MGSGDKDASTKKDGKFPKLELNGQTVFVIN